MIDYPTKTPEKEVPSAGEKTLSQKAIAGVGWSGLSSVVRQLLSFGSVALLARLLGPRAYGLIGMASVLIVFLSIFRDMGTTLAVIQRPNISGKLLSSLFWLNCAIGALLCLITALAAGPAAAFFHEPQLVGILRMLAPSFLLTSAGMMHYALLSRKMAFHKLAATELAAAIAGYCIAIPAAFAGYGVWSLVLANLTSSAVTCAMYWRLSGWRPSWQFDGTEVRSVARYSLNLSGFSFVNYFSRNADNLIVGRILGSSALGYYQMAYNLMMYPIQNLSQVLGQVLFPAFARIQHDDERFRAAYVRSCRLLTLVTFPVIAGMGVVAEPLIRTMLGEKWGPAILLFQILAPVGLVQSVQSTTGQIYMSKGRTDWMFRWGLYSGVVFVGSFLIGVRWGAVGVASAYACAYLTLIMYPCCAIPFSLIGLRVRDFLRELLPQFAITGLMVVLCALWLRGLQILSVTNPLIRLATAVVLGAAVYVSAMLILRPAVLDDLESLLQRSHNPVAKIGLRFLRGSGRATLQSGSAAL